MRTFQDTFSQNPDGFRVLVAVSLGLLACLPGRADAQGLDPQTFVPAPGPLSGVALERATVLRHSEWLLGVYLSEARDPLSARTACAAGQAGSDCRAALDGEPPISDLAQAELSAAVGLFGALELGVVAPVALVAALDDPRAPGGYKHQAGLADLRLAAKAAVLTGAVPVSLLFRASLPTGDPGELRGEGAWTACPAVAADFWVDEDGWPLLSAVVGYRLRPTQRFLELEVDDELDLGVAASLPLASFLRALVELRGRVGVGGALQRSENPVEIDLGARASPAAGVDVIAGAGLGLWPGRDAYGAPSFRIFAGLRLLLSPAGCPRGAGCGGGDSDRDGIEDASDICPRVAEDRDDFADDDGCPDLDNDADGILDHVDRCPRDTEDRDGHEDTDGCPEIDNDGDAVADPVDGCAMDPEDEDGFEDDDGCPEPGPEPPSISVTHGKILVSERIFFEFDRDVIRAVSMPLLDQLAEVIEGLSPDSVVQVVGHTDDSGNPEHNLDLSYRRAQSVATYLRARGVAGERLRAVGRGALEPLASDDSPEGRSLNRRVEFVLLKR